MIDFLSSTGLLLVDLTDFSSFGEGGGDCRRLDEEHIVSKNSTEPQAVPEIQSSFELIVGSFLILPPCFVWPILTKQ